MGSYQKFVLVTAIIILIISLVVIGYSLKKAKSALSWPPVTSQCPDYWRQDLSGNCINEKNLGTCVAPLGSNHLTLNFSDYTTCQKYTWANQCKVAWDGITYGVNNPCSS